MAEESVLGGNITESPNNPGVVVDFLLFFFLQLGQTKVYDNNIEMGVKQLIHNLYVPVNDSQLGEFVEISQPPGYAHCNFVLLRP